MHVYLNRIATAVPPYDVHPAFIAFARSWLCEPPQRALFDRMVAKAQIERRFSVLPAAREPEAGTVDALGVYRVDRFPSTAQRMQLYEKHAPELAAAAVDKLNLGPDARRITHLLLTSCTGMYAPGLELALMERFGLAGSVERSTLGFMGCYAAVNALKLARHIVRSEPEARVLVVNVELCSLHLQQTHDLEQLLSFLIFGDGCAASLISAEPHGLALDGFHAALLPNTRPLITWRVADQGFDMFLSGRVPGAIARSLGAVIHEALGGVQPRDIELWAVHPGGRSILDAVQHALELPPAALQSSRGVLQRFGNMSSPTLMFVLAEQLAAAERGQRGCAMAFGPGLAAESMLFHKA